VAGAPVDDLRRKPLSRLPGQFLEILAKGLATPSRPPRPGARLSRSSPEPGLRRALLRAASRPPGTCRSGTSYAQSPISRANRGRLQAMPHFHDFSARTSARVLRGALGELHGLGLPPQRAMTWRAAECASVIGAWRLGAAVDRPRRGALDRDHSLGSRRLFAPAISGSFSYILPGRPTRHLPERLLPWPYTRQRGAGAEQSTSTSALDAKCP